MPALSMPLMPETRRGFPGRYPPPGGMRNAGGRRYLPSGGGAISNRSPVPIHDPGGEIILFRSGVLRYRGLRVGLPLTLKPLRRHDHYRLGNIPYPGIRGVGPVRGADISAGIPNSLLQ